VVAIVVVPNKRTLPPHAHPQTQILLSQSSLPIRSANMILGVGKKKRKRKRQMLLLLFFLFLFKLKYNRVQKHKNRKQDTYFPAPLGPNSAQTRPPET
jgi:hypothetical protein